VRQTWNSPIPATTTTTTRVWCVRGCVVGKREKGARKVVHGEREREKEREPAPLSLLVCPVAVQGRTCVGADRTHNRARPPGARPANPWRGDYLRICGFSGDSGHLLDTLCIATWDSAETHRKCLQLRGPPSGAVGGHVTGIPRRECCLAPGTKRFPPGPGLGFPVSGTRVGVKIAKSRPAGFRTFRNGKGSSKPRPGGNPAI